MIIATAGHVDHGKTALVRNLTGVETDRLEEEQRRGLSINLGYAYWRPDKDTVLGFIDVPGHRRFINNMISGISGIDLGMLIVAADDGPMPQTREHVQVMDLLGVEHYLLVISKCDRVDQQTLDSVCKESLALLPEDTPVYKVSNTTGMGIDELRTELERWARQCRARTTVGQFRMSVDRAFNLQGRGLVVTGTIASGTVAVGNSVMLQPQGRGLRVRSVHTQDAPAEVAKAGERCALNVSGDVHKDDIERGDWVASETCIDTTSRFDARIRLLPDAAFALKNLSEVKLHIGAKHLKASLMLIKKKGASASRINPGETALAQIVTDRPILCCRGDRFLLRDHGETATLGGGVVLDPHGPRHRKSSKLRLTFLAAMESDNIEDAIRTALEADCTLDYGGLLKAWNLDPHNRPGSNLAEIARIRTDDGERWLAQSRWAALKQQVLDSLLKLHRGNATEQAVTPGRLKRAALPADEQCFFKQAIAELTKTKDILMKDGLLSARGHQATLADQERRDWLAISACLEKHGKQIPTASQLERDCGVAKPAMQLSLSRAQRDGRLVRMNAKRYALSSVLKEFSQAALEMTQDERKFTVIEYRNHLGCGRNIAIEVLEYFDGIRFTRRDGDCRIILDRTLPERLYKA